MKNYPSFEYNPGETDAVYHEDREVAGVMYRAANANYNDLHNYWSQNDTAQASYATAQSTDGSVSYLYMPAGTTGTWTTWQGQGQPVTYYAVNYGLTSGDLSGTFNTPALNAALAALIAAGGGTLSIPAGTYYINAPISLIGLTGGEGVIIEGVSGQTTLVQLSGVSIFGVSGIHNYAGVRFRDLSLKYSQMPVSSPFSAISVVNSDYVTCERVHFVDCPTAFQTDNASEFCGLSNCWIYYDLRDGEGNPVNDQTMIVLNGPDGFVANCVLHQMPLAHSPAGPTGCTGILLASNNGTRFISDTHINAFAVGIQITNSVVGIYCSDVRIDAYQNAVIIMPPSSDGTLYNVHFSNCEFGCTPEGGAPETSGVLISTNGGGPSHVAGIYFANCAAFGFGNAGIEIDGGKNIVIVGGQYSSNGQNPTPDTYLGAGIAVAGGEQVTISGVDCSGVNEYWKANASSPSTQPCGISISNDVADISNVVIDGCNLTGNQTNGIALAQIGTYTLGYVLISGCNANGYSSYSTTIDVSGTVSNVYVTNCAGYNDQTVEVTASAPASGARFNGTTHGYYGPTTFYIIGTGITAIKVASSPTATAITTGLLSGAFRLDPGEWGEIDKGVGVVTFALVGT